MVGKLKLVEKMRRKKKNCVIKDLAGQFHVSPEQVLMVVHAIGLEKLKETDIQSFLNFKEKAEVKA